MSKKRQKSNIKKIVLLINLIVFIFSIIKIGNANASSEPFLLKNVEIISKTDTTTINAITFDGETIENNIVFHNIGDSITYKITLKNNTDKKYILKAINNNNDNEYIEYEYEDYKNTLFNEKEEKIFNVKAKYVKELIDIEKRNQNFLVSFSFDLEEKKEEATNTSDATNTTNITNTTNTSNTTNTVNTTNINNTVNTTNTNTNNTTNTNTNNTTNTSNIANTEANENEIPTETTITQEKNEEKVPENLESYEEPIQATYTNPKTGDDVTVYIILASVSCFILIMIILSNKKIKKSKKVIGIILALCIAVPTIAKANSFNFEISINNTISLQDKLVAKYTINGQEITQIVNYGEKLTKPENPNIDGYRFEGWVLNDNTPYDFEQPVKEDQNIKAKIIPIEYRITYNGINDAEKGVLHNPEIYTVESETIRLNNPRDRKDNDDDVTERFLGWKENETTSIDAQITKGSTGDKTFTAQWKSISPDEYIIQYTLNDGTLENENPTTFTKNTETFTLNYPSKNGYKFIGWTGSNGETPQKDVQVLKGTREDLNFTANFEIEQYTISYELDGGEADNITDYTVESEDIVLTKPVKKGYHFTGWTGTGLNQQTENVIIRTGSFGNKTFTANYEPNTYFVKFDANTGLGSMPDQGIVYDEEESLNENILIKQGYSFTGWNTEANGSGIGYEDKQNVENLIDEGNFTLYAQWQANTYTIKYHNNIEGEEDITTSSEHTYDIKKSLTANTFERLGYTFSTWTTNVDGTGESYQDEEQVMNLATEGETNLYAQWTENSYAVKFNANGGNGTNMPNEIFSYKEEKALSTNTYVKENSVFLCWNTKADGTGTEYEEEQLVKELTPDNNGLIELFAIWKKIDIGDYIDYDANTGLGTGLMYTASDLPEVYSDDPENGISGNFKSSENIKWRIFNVTNEGIEVIAEKPLNNTLKLNGANGYIYGEKVLNDICDVYGHGVGAIDSRSIKIEDIEPNFKFNKMSFSYGGLTYGQIRTYASGNFIVGNDIVPANFTQRQSATYTAYWFNVNDSANIYTEAENKDANKIYQMLCRDISITNVDNNPNYTPYWIASRCTRAEPNYCFYGLHYIGDMHSLGESGAEMGLRALYTSNGTTYTAENGVLPIVKLHSTVKLTYNRDSQTWKINYTPVNYTISFDSNGGTGNMENQTFEVGEEKCLSQNEFTRENYVFNGWNTQANGMETHYLNKQSVKNLALNEENITLYATWINIKIGDYINYNPNTGAGSGLSYTSQSITTNGDISISNTFKSNDNIRWRVCNIKNDIIQIMAEYPTAQTVELRGNGGFLNGQQVLNDICDIYGHGDGAIGGRSINLSDIEPYFKYDKTNFENVYSSTERYGGTRKYTSGTFLINNQYVTATESNPRNITHTAYWFNVIDAENRYTSLENPVANKIYQMLCVDIPINSSNPNYTPYWIADRCTYVREEYCQDYMHYMGDLHANGNSEMGGIWLRTSNGAHGGGDLHVLPIVALDSSSIYYSLNQQNNSWDINCE